MCQPTGCKFHVVATMAPEWRMVHCLTMGFRCIAHYGIYCMPAHLWRKDVVPCNSVAPIRQTQCTLVDMRTERKGPCRMTGPFA